MEFRPMPIGPCPSTVQVTHVTATVTGITGFLAL